MATQLGELIDILESQGVGGQALKDLADKVNGPRDEETGLRGKGEKAEKEDAPDDNAKKS